MRVYKRKSEKGMTDKEVLKKAVNAVVVKKQKIGAVASQYNIPKRTLSRYCFKTRNKNQENNTDTSLQENIANLNIGYQRNRLVS